MIVPERLSTSEAKRDLYATDPHFRAGLISVANAVGADGVADFTWPLASVLLKPESLVGRTAVECCTFLLSRGFVPLAATAVQISSFAVRELWRYQINVATEERLYAMDRIFASGPSVYLVFRYPVGGVSEGASASFILNAMKGPSEPSARMPWHLRSSIGAVPSRLLTHIHAAEEPADVIRDMGALFDESQRQGLLRSFQLGDVEPEQMLGFVREVMGEYAPHDLDPGNSISRLRRAIDGAADRGQNRDIAFAMQWLDAAEHGAGSDWYGFVHYLSTRYIDVNVWDLIVSGSDVMTMDVGGERRLLGDEAVVHSG